MGDFKPLRRAGESARARAEPQDDYVLAQW
jgi:hypothetical protein